MRIVVDTIPLLSPLTGVGHYVDQLVRRLRRLAPENEYTYYSGYFTKSPPRADGRVDGLKKMLSGVPFLMSGLNRARGVMARLSPREFDLYFQPNFIPLDIKAQKTVVTVHDLAFLSGQDWHPKYRSDYFARQFRKNIARADRVITDSAYVKKQAVSVLGLPEEKVSAVALGVDREVFRRADPEALEAFRKRAGLFGPFILFVGTLEPRKNLRRLLTAYLELPEALKKEFRLVLAGSRGWKSADLAELLDKMGDRVVYLGYVETRELVCLYSLASLFVFPSLDEGFGLPPLEAMACGCPVVASSAASLPEVCGDAAQYADPNDVSSIAAGMARVLSDQELRRRLIQKGAERAALFSWDDTAAQTLAIFKEELASC